MIGAAIMSVERSTPRDKRGQRHDRNKRGTVHGFQLVNRFFVAVSSVLALSRCFCATG